MIDLENYTLVYNITALPNVLFAQTTKALEPLSFDPEKFVIPTQLSGQQLEIRIGLYDNKGRCIQLASNMVIANTKFVCQSAEYTGLKMIETLLSQDSD